MDGPARDSEDDMREFARTKGAAFPLCKNNTHTNVVKMFGVSGYPTNILFDRDGNVVAKLVGFSLERLQSALRKVGLETQ